MPPNSFSLGKEKRLKSRKAIEGVFKAGRSVSNPPFRIVYQFQEGEGQFLQAGFSAPTRNFKKAVARNRVKRLMKEAYRLNCHPLESCMKSMNRRLAIFLIYTARELPEQAFTTEKISVLLQKLIKKINEGSSKSA
jgi:ribonuclease P protein component